MKKTAILLALLALGLTGFAQTILMQNTNPMKPYQEKKEGENLKNYSQGFIGFGVLAPVGTTHDDTYFGKSFVFDLGYRYRYRVSNFIHIGNDLSYNIQTNRLDHSGMKKVYDKMTHDRETIIQNELRISPFIRFNLTPNRGNYLGTYLDLGGYFGWNFLPIFRAVDKAHNGNEKVKYIRNFDPNQNIYDYGVTGRIARNKNLLFVSYRLSDIMKNKDLPELPRLSVGIQFGF